MKKIKFILSSAFILINFSYAGQHYNYSYNTNNYNYVKGGYTKSNTHNDKDIDKAAELELIGLNPSIKATYNPSKNIGQWLNNKLSSTNSQTGEKKASWFQKTGTSIWNTLNANKSDEKKVNKFFQKYNLPVSAKVTKEKVANMTLSYSLVNDKCEIDPKKIWAEQMEKLVKKYKEMWNQLKNKGLWKMWAINTAIEKVTHFFAFESCTKQLFNPKTNPTYKKDLKTATSKYQGCMADKLKGSVQASTGTQTGTTNSAQTSVKMDLKTQALLPVYSYICSDNAMYETFGKRYDKCIDDKTSQYLGWINGKINLGIKMGLLNFKLKQQACILKKYNMELDLTKVITDAFKLNAKGNKLTITNKNSKANSPTYQGQISDGVFKSYNYIFNGKNNMEKLLNILKQEGKTGTIKTSNGQAEYSKAVLSLQMYSFIFTNWLYDTFGKSNKITTVTVKSNEGDTIIQANVFQDRWQLPVYVGYTRKEMFNNYPQLGQTNVKQSLKTYKIASTLEECQSIVTDLNSPSIFLWGTYAKNVDAQMSKDDTTDANVIQLLKLNGRLTSYKSRASYYFNVKHYSISSYIALLVDMDNIDNHPDNKIITALKSNALNIFTKLQMVSACTFWANGMLYKMKEIEATQIKQTALASKISNGKKIGKVESQIIQKLQENLKTYLGVLKSEIQDVINAGYKNLGILNNQWQYIQKSLKEKDRISVPQFYFRPMGNIEGIQ